MTAPIVGLGDQDIRIDEWSPAWPVEFQAIRTVLAAHLLGSRIEHVGSTAVPGLPAKPIIDISVGLPAATTFSAEDAQACHLRFRRVLPDSVLFARFDQSSLRTAQVHIRHIGSAGERRDILIRDYLRAHPDAAAAYAEVKRQAATAREGYSAKKGPFLTEMVRQADSWAAATGWKLP